MSDQFITKDSYSQTATAIKSRSKRLQNPELLEKLRAKCKKHHAKKRGDKLVKKLLRHVGPMRMMGQWKQIEGHLNRGRDSGYIALATGQLQSVVVEFIVSIRLVERGVSTKEKEIDRIKRFIVENGKQMNGKNKK